MGRVPPTVVIATSNEGKRREWAELLAEIGVTTLPDRGPAPAETADDYVGNALLKALAAAARTGWPALGDDVGLEIDAFGGAPGVHLRPWAEQLGGWSAAIAHVVRHAEGSGAVYACGVALAWPTGRRVTGLGRVRGTLVAPRAAGPGLEGCFVPEGSSEVLAEMSPERRKEAHHRHRAFGRLLAELSRAP